MPRPNFHSARLHDPGDFKERPDWAGAEGGKFRTTHGGNLYGGNLVVPETIHVVWGQLASQSGDQAAPQTLLFPAETWTEERAKKWLEEHNVKFISFEAATGETANSVTCSVDLLTPQSALRSPQSQIENPRWIMVARVGEWRGHAKGTLRVTADDIRSMADHFDQRYRAHGVDLVIDYEHQSLAASFLGEKAPAAAWVSDLQVRNDGLELWARVRFTDRAVELMAAREYRYLSPVFIPNRADAVTGRKWPMILDSAALTNKPFLTELPALVNRSDGGARMDPRVARQQEDGGMKDLLKLVAGIWANSVADAARFLGLAETASDQDVLTALAARAKEAVAGAALAAGFANALGVPPDKAVETVQAKLQTLGAIQSAIAVVANSLGLTPDAKPEDMVKLISDLRAQAADTKAEKLISNAVEAGKIPPANKVWWIEQAKREFAQTEKIVNALPTVLSPGSGATGAPPSGNEDPEKVFANSAELQDEFGDVKTYKAFLQAVKEGRVTVVGKKQ